MLNTITSNISVPMIKVVKIYPVKLSALNYLSEIYLQLYIPMQNLPMFM